MTDNNTFTIRGDGSFFGDELPQRVELIHEDTGARREYKLVSTDLQDRIDEEWRSVAVDPGVTVNMSDSTAFCDEHTLRHEVRNDPDDLSLVVRKTTCTDCPYWRSESVPTEQVTLGEVTQ